jgi:hypothetical protein
VDKNNFLEALTVQNLTFFYHPCGDTKSLPNINGTNECKDGYSVCVFNHTSGDAKVLGHNKDLKFKTSENTVDLIYSRDGTLLGDKVTTISLQCTPNALSSYLYSPLKNINLDQVVSFL